jgi:hypothetical protein
MGERGVGCLHKRDTMCISPFVLLLPSNSPPSLPPSRPPARPPSSASTTARNGRPSSPRPTGCSNSIRPPSTPPPKVAEARPPRSFSIGREGGREGGRRGLLGPKPSCRCGGGRGRTRWECPLSPPLIQVHPFLPPSLPPSLPASPPLPSVLQLDDVLPEAQNPRGSFCLRHLRGLPPRGLAPRRGAA